MVPGKIAFIADLHIKPYIWAHRSPVTGDAAYALEQIRHILLEEQVGDVFYLGDLSDSPEIDGETGRLLRELTDALHKAGARQYAIQGNHDRGGTPICRMFGIEHINGRTMECCGLKIYGQDYMHTEAARQALAGVPPCDLLLMHTAFRHLLGFDGKWQFMAEDVPDHVGTVIAGDIHKHARYRLPRSAAGTSREIISPGSIYPVKADEAGLDHGFVLFNGMGFEYRRLECRSMTRYDGAVEGLGSFLEKTAREHAGERLPPVVMARECPQDLHGTDTGVVIIETGHAVQAGADETPLQTAYTLKEALDERYAMGNMDLKLKAAAERLLDSTSPAKELELLLAEAKVELQLR
jgi:hypothetical protein